MLHVRFDELHITFQMDSLFIINTSDSCEDGYRIDCDKYGDYDPIIFPTIMLDVMFEEFT